MRQHFKPGLSFLGHVFGMANRHDVWGMAAEIGFVLMFAFFQALLLFVSVLSILGAQPDVFNSIIYFFGSFLPFELYHLIRKQILDMVQGEPGGIFIFSLIGTVWTMNTLVYTLKKNFERSYHIKETRSFWKVRLIVFYIAILATMGIGITLVLLLFGLQIARFIEHTLGYAHLFASLIRVLRLPVAFLVTTSMASLVYWAIVNVEKALIEILPGALFFCLLWFLSTFGFGMYLRNFPYFNATYGTLGVFIVLMGWMYLTALSALLGGEVNAEIYRRRAAARHAN